MTPEAVLIESMLMIADKDGNDVPFKLNSAQRTVDEQLTGRDIIPKARQEGVSSYFLARSFIKCLTRRNRRAVIISHEQESTERMLQKVHYFAEHLEPKAVIGRASKNEITFPKTNSVFYIGTAGARTFGRGDTITDLHCSEVAFWKDAKTLMTGLLQAVPRSGEISIESTGNGEGNYYHKICMTALNDKYSRYTLHFLSWLTFDEYNLPVTEEEARNIMENLDDDLDEPAQVEKYNLTPGQIKFRREKLADLEYDLSLVAQEYPAVLSDCFRASGTGIFRVVNYVETDDWVRGSPQLHHLLTHPVVGRHYTIGVDVSGGVGEDSSVVEVYDLETLEQVAEWVCNQTSPDELSAVVAEIGTRYNEAFVTVEANNYGITTLDRLKDIYPQWLIYQEDRNPPKYANEPQELLNYGFRTTHVTKPFILGKLRVFLKNDIVIHSKRLREELSTFIETDSGKLEAQSGCYDDTVMATAMITVSLAKHNPDTLPKPEEHKRITLENAITLDAAIEELNGRRDGGLPIKSMVA